MEFSASQIAEFIKGEIVGDKDIKVNNFSKIEEGKKGTISFLANPKYTQYIYTTKADIVIVNKTFVAEEPISATLIRVDNAYEAIGHLLRLVDKLNPSKTGISPKSDIDVSATIGENVYVGAFVTIGQNSKIGNNVRIYPNTQIADNVSIGDDTTIFANVSIYNDCVVGKNNIIHSGSVIGADGFGFAPNTDGHYNKIPQIGNVVLGDNVEIGANSTIDRATIGSTFVGNGVKIDNLVQIAHNVDIGDHTAIAAQSGIAGSTKVGKRCIFAGQTGVSGHISLAEGTILGAQAGVNNNIKQPNTILQGTPAIPVANFRRSSVGFKQLPELIYKIYELEKKLKK